MQTCVIHLIRSSLKYISWKDRKRAAAFMRPVYTAVNEAGSESRPGEHAPRVRQEGPGDGRGLGKGLGRVLGPFLRFDTAIRKVIYTTNAIES